MKVDIFLFYTKAFIWAPCFLFYQQIDKNPADYFIVWCLLIHTACTTCTYYMYTLYLLHVHLVLTTCTPCTYYMYTLYLPSYRWGIIQLVLQLRELVVMTRFVNSYYMTFCSILWITNICPILVCMWCWTETKNYFRQAKGLIYLCASLFYLPHWVSLIFLLYVNS